MTEETAAPPEGIAGIRDAVTVRMPAASAYLSVLRTATAGLAARLDFTLDEIEDLRIAVDEACAMLLRQAVPGTDLLTEFELTDVQMSIRVSVSTVDATMPDSGKDPRVPDRTEFAWMVLTALADDVDATTEPDDRMAIVLRKRRGPATPDSGDGA